MCRWMGSHFHDWTDYNGVAFLVELQIIRATVFIFRIFCVVMGPLKLTQLGSSFGLARV